MKIAVTRTALIAALTVIAFLLAGEKGLLFAAQPTQSSSTPNQTMTKDINRQIVYAEGKSFRGSPTSTVPAGTQYCGADSAMGSDQDKQDAFTEMARVNLARAHCGLSWGDGVGTAKPEKPPKNPLPSQTSSWKMAGKAADKAQEEWDAKSKEEKDAECKKGALYYYHVCYCCKADSDDEQCALQIESIAESISEGGGTGFVGTTNELSTEGSCVLPLPGSGGGAGDEECGCSKDGNVTDADSYSRIDCPCCPHSAVPDWWGDAKVESSGSNLYDPNSGCWRETKVRQGGKA